MLFWLEEGGMGGFVGEGVGCGGVVVDEWWKEGCCVGRRLIGGDVWRRR